MQTTQCKLLDPDAVIRDIYIRIQQLDPKQHSCLNEIFILMENQHRDDGQDAQLFENKSI